MPPKVGNNPVNGSLDSIWSQVAPLNPGIIRIGGITDHLGLEIQCNRFEEYSNYGILSNNSIVNNQGTAQIGAGNKFLSNPNRTNHQFLHWGNPLIYYYDPSYPMVFSPGSGTVTPLAALEDRGCLEDNNRLGSFSSEQNQLTPSLSIEKLIELIPNPSTGIFVFRSALEIPEIEITIFSSIGELVGTFSDISSGSWIDISRENSGIYLCVIKSGGKIISKKKLVVSK